MRRHSTRESAARTYARALPIVPVRARGLTIEGADGRRYLDCLSGAGTLALGHNHPVVLEAIRKVLDSGAPLNALDLATPVKDAFLTELLRTLPRGLADRARVRFCGPADSEAIETACALLRTATGRSGVLTFTSAGGGTESHLDHSRGGVPLPAGVIVEPVQGEGGMVPAPDTWLRRMRQLTADRSVPLIADETQTGVGRTGAFWAVEHSGVTPDVMVLSKAIGGSLPLAVVVYSDDLETAETGIPSDTFQGNQLAMAAGTATLAHVRENALADRAATLGARMLHQLRGLTSEFSWVGDVRGRGLMIGVELTDPEGAPQAPCPAPDAEAGAGTEVGTGTWPRVRARAGAPMSSGPTRPPLAAAPAFAATVQQECLRRGLIVGLGGPHASVVQLLPPLTITDEQAAAVLDRLADAVGAAARLRGGDTAATP
ncbi:aminotransferase class III-fold pyridoxal phosphate-dependent enzyme [Streptomyces sp. NPDC050698]